VVRCVASQFLRSFPELLTANIAALERLSVTAHPLYRQKYPPPNASAVAAAPADSKAPAAVPSSGAAGDAAPSGTGHFPEGRARVQALATPFFDTLKDEPLREHFLRCTYSLAQAVQRPAKFRALTRFSAVLCCAALLLCCVVFRR
jgi:hypothetical protein